MKLYYEGFGAKLFHADCGEAAVDCDLIATDPPYGQRFVSGKAGGKWGELFGDDSPTWIEDRLTAAIQLTPAEIQSGHDRVKWAEGLILQLPEMHDGRNSWLLNYGIGPEAELLRENRRRGIPYKPPLSYVPTTPSGER